MEKTTKLALLSFVGLSSIASAATYTIGSGQDSEWSAFSGLTDTEVNAGPFSLLVEDFDVDGVLTDFTINLTQNGTAAGLAIRANTLTASTGSDRFEDGEGAYITITGVTSTDVTFEGFSGFQLGAANSDGEGAIVNTETFGGNGPHTLASLGAVFDHVSTGSNTSLHSVVLEFSSVPEPSSAAIIIGLASLAIVARRRRR